MKISPVTKGIAMITLAALILTVCSQLAIPSAKKIAKSVAPLQTIDGRNYCSSSQISYKGKVVTMTNLHCCAAYPIEQADGSYSISVEGNLRKILYISKTNDLCLAEPTGAKALPIAGGETHAGDKLYMMGYPYGQGPKFVVGSLESKYDLIALGFFDYFIVDTINMMAFPGNSGSPVLNNHGEVVGLLFAGMIKYPFYGSMVPIKLIRKDLDTYVKSSR